MSYTKRYIERLMDEGFDLFGSEHDIDYDYFHNYHPTSDVAYDDESDYHYELSWNNRVLDIAETISDAFHLKDYWEVNPIFKLNDGIKINRINSI